MDMESVVVDESHLDRYITLIAANMGDRPLLVAHFRTLLKKLLEDEFLNVADLIELMTVNYDDLAEQNLRYPLAAEVLEAGEMVIAP